MNKYALLGCGRSGLKFVEQFKKQGLEIGQFADTYKQGQLLCDREVLAPDQLITLYKSHEVDTIIVSIISEVERTDMGIWLLEKGVDPKNVYFVPEWFINFPNELNDIRRDLVCMKNAKPTLNYLDIPVVDWCNLKCKNCWMACNLVEEGQATPFSVYRADMEQMTKKYDNIESIHFMGGEPFLHPNLGDYIKTAKELFPRSPLYITSNGTVIDRASEETLDIIRTYDVTVFVSLYPVFVNRLYDLVKLMEKNRIRLEYSLEKKEFLKLFSFDEQDVEQTRAVCPNTKCHYLQNGRIYGCGVPITMRRLNKIADINWAEEEKGFDIYSEMTGWEIMSGLNRAFSSCRHCTANMRAEKWEVAGTNVKIGDYFV